MKKLLTSILPSSISAVLMLTSCFNLPAMSMTVLASETETEAVISTTDTSDSDPIMVGVSYVTSSSNPIDNSWDLTAHGISEGLYMQDADGNLTSRFISDLERDDDLTWTATLTNTVKFSDGTDCDAQAIADCMNTIQEENSMSNGTAGKVTFTVVDEDTLQIVTQTATPVMASLLCEWTNVVFKESDDDYIFTGPYVIDDLDSDVSLEMSPNQYYDDRASERSDVTLKVFSDTSAMQQAFESGEIDLMFGLTAEVADILTAEGLTVKDMNAGYQYFAVVNMSQSPLDDLNVREAINLTMNRDDMVTALEGGRVANGIFAQYYSFAGDVEEVTDLEAAAEKLEAAGYEKGSDGMYAKDGETLSLKLITYSARADLPILMQLATSELTELGIDVTTEIVDDISTALSDGDFDIAFYAQHTAPSGEPSAFFNMWYASDGTRNYVGYENSELEDLLSQMGDTEEGDERDELSVQVQDIVAEDLPMIYLIDPQWHIAVSDRIADYEPYCGDYYVVNAELGL